MAATWCWCPFAESAIGFGSNLFGLSLVVCKKKKYGKLLCKKIMNTSSRCESNEKDVWGGLDFHVRIGLFCIYSDMVYKDISFITYNHTTYKPDTLLPVYPCFVLHNL